MIDVAISHLTVDCYPVFRAMCAYTRLLRGLLVYLCLGVTRCYFDMVAFLVFVTGVTGVFGRSSTQPHPTWVP